MAEGPQEKPYATPGARVKSGCLTLTRKRACCDAPSVLLVLHGLLGLADKKLS
jgi:hypothetical protein